jgi:hypothetical protein
VLVPAAHDLVEVGGLALRQAAEPQVVDDQHVGSGEAEEPLLVAAVAARSAELHEQFVRSHVRHREPGAAGAIAEPLGEVALADARGPDDVQVIVALNERAGCELEDLGLRDRGVEGEVEVLDGLRMLEVGAGSAA